MMHGTMNVKLEGKFRLGSFRLGYREMCILYLHKFCPYHFFQ